MYFVMVDHRENGLVYSRRVGQMTTDYKRAVKTALKRSGYIMNESRKLIGQAFDSSLPSYIGALK